MYIRIIWIFTVIFFTESKYHNQRIRINSKYILRPTAIFQITYSRCNSKLIFTFRNIPKENTIFYGIRDLSETWKKFERPANQEIYTARSDATASKDLIRNAISASPQIQIMDGTRNNRIEQRHRKSQRPIFADSSVHSPPLPFWLIIQIWFAVLIVSLRINELVFQDRRSGF